MKTTRRIIPVATALACFAGTAAAQSITAIGDLPGGLVYSSAASISADGSITVGSSKDSNNDKPVTWTPGSGLNSLGLLPGASFSQALAVSGDGKSIWGGVNYINGTVGAFRWNSGSGMIALPAWAGHTTNYAYGCSHNGFYGVGYGVVTANARNEGYRWSAGGYQSVGLLSGFVESVAYGISGDGNTVVGFCDGSHSNLSRAFRWTQAGGIQDLGTTPGKTSAIAFKTSFDGSVVVGYCGNGAGQPYRPVRWTVGAGAIDLGGFAPGASGTAFACSGDGSVVVGDGYGTPGAVSETRAFIWDTDHGFRQLSDALISAGVNMTGWTLTSASSVSYDGSVVCGQGIDPLGRTTGYVARLRPECKGDLNGDGVVNTIDLTLLLSRFGTSAIPFLDGDLDGSGVINTSDLTQFLSNFGHNCN